MHTANLVSYLLGKCLPTEPGLPDCGQREFQSPGTGGGGGHSKSEAVTGCCKQSEFLYFL